MSEPDLTLTYADLRESIAFHLGYGRDDTAWSADQIANINKMLDDGLRQFYSPPIVDKREGSSHRWSFINIVSVFDMKGGETVYQLPDNFGGITSVATYEKNKGWWEMRQVDEEMIRVQEQTVDSTHIPHWFAIRPRANMDPAIGQRYEMVVYPTPDADYRLQYRYRIRPDKLSSTKIYHHGMGLHSDTLEASCLACCELKMDDTRGPHWANFLELLERSISIDASLEASYQGYNSDNSDLGSGYSAGEFQDQLRARRGGTFTFTNGTEI